MAGESLTNVLSGKVNPSGKLPVTFGKHLGDYGFAHYGKEAYPGVDGQVNYKEDIYVGYRWFDTKRVAPRFPFGFGSELYDLQVW
jgi:beta-glucosidase